MDHHQIAAEAKGVSRFETPEAQRFVDIADLPQDSREWVDPCTLSLWVQEAVETLTSNQPGEAGARFNPEGIRLFELLTFAYATNVLASTEISAACRSNPAFRFLSAGEIPFPEEITCFRRRHRVQLESVLTRVLACVMSSRHGEVHPTVYLALLCNARERLDIARLLDEE